jgi:hypothetical protein
MNLSRDAVIGLIVLAIIALTSIWYVVSRPPTEVTENPTASTTATGGPGHITEHAQYYDVDAKYPPSTALAGLPNSADVNAVALMKQWELDTVASFKSDSGLNNLTSDDIKTQGLGPDRKYALTITYKTYTSAHTTSYVYAVFEDTLGAHPNTTYKTFSFDTTTGQNLFLAMLFTPGTDYLGTLSKIAKAELPAIIAARENVKTSEIDMDMLNAGITPTADNFSNFYLGGTDLVILFSPYQIGPYVLGSTEFHIPLSKITGLKADYK